MLGKPQHTHPPPLTKTQKKTSKTRECDMKPSDMASLSNSRWQTRLVRLNRSTTTERWPKFTLLSPLKIQECAMKPSEMTSLLNSRWQKRPNRFKNNGDMAETANRYVFFD